MSKNGNTEGNGPTIVRSWKARASEAGAREYAAFFRNTLARAMKAIPGNRGAMMLSRHYDGGEVELVMLSYWDSMEAVGRFAGDAPERAVVEPRAREILSSYDETVEHYTLDVSNVPV